MFNRKTIAASLALAMALPAYATDLSGVPGGVATAITSPVPSRQPEAQISPASMQRAEEIANINERIGVLSARLQELEVQAKIASKQEEINKARFSGMDTTSLPTVTGISGVDGVLKATLMEQNGRTQSAKIGDMVGAWKITDIQMDSVTVKQGKKSVKLSFSGQAINQFMNPSQGYQGVPAIPQ
jgi:TolA-binding protein